MNLNFYVLKRDEYFLSEWVGHVTLFRVTKIMRTGRPMVERWKKTAQRWDVPRPIRPSIPLQTITAGEARRLMRSHAPYVMGTV
jgi:hypothetical protein